MNYNTLRRSLMIVALLAFAVAGLFAVKVSVERDATESGMETLAAYDTKLSELNSTLTTWQERLEKIAELQAERQKQLDRQQELINVISATLDQRGRTLDHWQSILEAR